jgi:hypothetical protein
MSSIPMVQCVMASVGTILSPIREKLVGIWEVRAQTWKIDREEIAQASHT